MCFYLRNWQVTFLLYTLGVFISEYTAKAFTEPRDYRVVFLIQITGTLFNHSIPAIIHSERAGIRTPDNLIKSQVLYHLSYTPIKTGLVGFEPTNAGVKVLCLTAWR